MVLVPTDTPGVTNVRALPVFGYQDREGHCEIVFDDVRVPRSNILGEEGGGFAMAQARLGPGRIHHCMRTIGAAERALELLCRRAQTRTAFGKPLAEQGVIQTWVADARIDIDQARLYTFYAAWLMDTQGNKAARTEISGIKVAVPQMALRIIDHAIQAHGAAGISDDFGLSSLYAHIRTLRLADGPDEVHRMTVARRELRKYAEMAEAAEPRPLTSGRLCCARTVPTRDRGDVMRKFLACSLVGVVVFGGALAACGGGGGGGGSQQAFCDALKKDESVFSDLSDQSDLNDSQSLSVIQSALRRPREQGAERDQGRHADRRQGRQGLALGGGRVQLGAKSSADFSKLSDLEQSFSDQNQGIEKASQNIDKYAKDKCGIDLNSRQLLEQLVVERVELVERPVQRPQRPEQPQ